MSQVTIAELVAEIPTWKWYEGWDRSLFIAIFISALLHAIGAAYVHSMPLPQKSVLFPLQVAYPPVFQQVIDDWPPDERIEKNGNQTAIDKALRPGRGPGNGPGGGLVALFQDGRSDKQLIELITSSRDVEGSLAGIRGLPNKEIRLTGGGLSVRSATDGVGTTPGDGEIVSTDVAGLTGDLPAGPVRIEERRQRQVTSKMKKPVFDVADPDANRIVRLALYQRVPAVKHCYEMALKTKPHLSGSLRVRLTFSENGTVESVAVLEDSMGDAQFLACVMRVLRQTRTNLPLNKKTAVNVPYIFTAIEG